jgi:hypothetical protein
MGNATNININFSRGLDTKTDPFQLQVGQFLELNNSVFQKGGLLSKRYGYQNIASYMQDGAFITTLDDNIIVVGETFAPYDIATESFLKDGFLSPCSVSVQPLVRNSVNQIQVDSAISGDICLVTYTQQTGSGPTYNYLWALKVVDTDQYLIQPTAIPVLSGGAISGSSRVFVVGNFFVVVSPVTVSGTVYLQYFSISESGSASAAQNVYAEAYVPISSNPGWDGAVGLDGNLLVAYNSTAGGQGVHVTFLTTLQIAGNQAGTTVHKFTSSSYIGAIVSVCVDNTVAPNPYLYYISFYNNSTTTTYVACVYLGHGGITVQFTPTSIDASDTIDNLASAAQSTGGSSSCLVFLEVANTYSYNSQPTNYINWVSITQGGTASSPAVLIRSVGLASKGAIVGGFVYILTAFQSPYQPTYFLICATDIINEGNVYVTAKLAYQNGGGYLARGLPYMGVEGDTLSVPYLFKQDVIALNSVANPQQSAAGGVYSQLGVNQAFILLGTQDLQSTELAGDLLLTGGYLGMYDTTLPVEQNFFLFPETVALSFSDSSGSVGNGTYWYSVTYEWTDAAGNTYRSQPSVPVSITVSTGPGTVTVNVPTLRVTQKYGSYPALIVVYRYDSTNGAYNQVSSVINPTINDLTVDFIAIADANADSAIVGNNILYTTGGVVPDTNGPASNIMTVFDTRLVMVSAEAPNLLWFSKTLVQNVPVEMSSFFTVYISPNIGSSVASGPITALYAMDDKLIIFLKDKIYYMNGTGPDNLGTTSPGSPLGNYSPPTFITAAVGCTNQKSIVLTPNGLMFQTNKGIWLLGRDLSTSYIGAPVEQYNSSLVTSAQVIPGMNFVVLTLDSGPTLMYDYYYQQWGTWSGPEEIISSCIQNGMHTVLTSSGLVLQQTAGTYVDNATPVLMNFTTSWINLASLQGYERFKQMYLLATFLSPHSLEVGVAYDYNPSLYHSSLITPDNYSTNVPGPFGVPTPFGAYAQVEQWRVHAKQQLCQSFQLSIQEVFNSADQTEPGAGFSMSGINCEVQIKRATRPIRGANAVG